MFESFPGSRDGALGAVFKGSHFIEGVAKIPVGSSDGFAEGPKVGLQVEVVLLVDVGAVVAPVTAVAEILVTRVGLGFGSCVSQAAEGSADTVK